MKVPFKYLDWPRNDRAKYLQKLIGDILKRDMVFIVVRTEVQPFQGTRSKSLRVAKGRGFSVYAVTVDEQITQGINLLGKMRLWHKPVFHILVGYQDLLRKLVNKCNQEKESRIEKIEQKLESDIIGYIDPVDDVLECYGNGPFIGVVSGVTS